MEELADFFTHLTISATRYNDPAAYVAYDLDADEVDGGLFGGDTDAWKTSREMQEQHEYLWAEGKTIEDAISNLFVERFFSFYSLMDHMEELKQNGTITVVYYWHRVTFSVQELCKMLAKHLSYIKFRSTEFSEAYYAKRTAELAELGFSIERENNGMTVVTFNSQDLHTSDSDEWISIGEQLPQLGVDVLCQFEEGIEIAHLQRTTRGFEWSCDGARWANRWKPISSTKLTDYFK